MSHNRNKNEEEYFKYRELLLGTVPLLSFVDQPMVFASRQAVCNIITRVKLFDLIKDVKGSIIECGVHKGSDFMLFNHLSSIMEPYAFDRKIYGFDTFNGFTNISEKDGSGAEEDFSDASEIDIQAALNLADKNRPVGHVPKGELIKGNACETIPEFVQLHSELIVSMLYLDFDLYAPTKTAISAFLPLMPKGAIVVFDELNSPKWKGETLAAKELFNLNNIEIKKFPHDPRVSYFRVGI